MAPESKKWYERSYKEHKQYFHSFIIKFIHQILSKTNSRTNWRLFVYYWISSWRSTNTNAGLDPVLRRSLPQIGLGTRWIATLRLCPACVVRATSVGSRNTAQNAFHFSSAKFFLVFHKIIKFKIIDLPTLRFGNHTAYIIKCMHLSFWPKRYLTILKTEVKPLVIVVVNRSLPFVQFNLGLQNRRRTISYEGNLSWMKY